MPRPRADQPTYSLTVRQGRYYIQWWEDGAARRVSCRTSLAPAARRFLEEFKAARNAPVIPDAPTIGDILDAYLQDRQHRSLSHTVPNVLNTIKGGLADLPADLLTRDRVRLYLQERRAGGLRGAAFAPPRKDRQPCDMTLRTELAMLRAALNWAHREGWISRVPQFELPPPSRPRQRWLTRDEAERLLAATDVLHMRIFVLLGLYTAARAGAILELTWDRVDFDRGIIDFGHGPSSNKSRAVVPMHDRLRAPLLAARDRRRTNFVLEWRAKRIASISFGFRALAERAGVPGTTPHTLRHTAASWMAHAGVPLEQIAAFLGNSPSVVARHYVHHQPGYLDRAVQALGG